MCGADVNYSIGDTAKPGSSPRVRSRPGLAGWHRTHPGIISACAEQTVVNFNEITNRWDHLRVCGADMGDYIGGDYAGGSSPRVRSRRRSMSHCPAMYTRGIISACAEQTGIRQRPLHSIGDHLRVCGADSARDMVAGVRDGSSPRVRSRPNCLVSSLSCSGIISACAEQTGNHRADGREGWDHLRVCGADDIIEQCLTAETGSSPRVRSRQVVRLHKEFKEGIISACAEQTPLAELHATVDGDHLRVCGADPHYGCCRTIARGSSPRVRSRRTRTHAEGRGPGIISACAEQT